MASPTVWKITRRMFVFAALGVLSVLLNVASPVFAQSRATGKTATAVTQTRTTPTGAARVFGIDDGGVVSSNQQTTNLAAATGANWERISLYWSKLEPTKGNYDFSSSDVVLSRLLTAGFSPIVYLEKNPAWASNTDCGPVNDINAFATMMGKLAERYPDVKIWAAYNEVDFDYANIDANTGGCFGSRTAGGVNNNGVKDVNEYAQMLAAGWKAVHTANPNALFASGAVAYDNFNASTAPAGYPGGGSGGIFNYNFLPDLFSYMSSHPLSNGDKYMDMVLFNYYNLYGPYWEARSTGFGIQAKTRILRRVMSDGGVPVVPLFVTETGEKSLSTWAGLDGQARCLSMFMVRGAAVGLTGITWWTFRDFPDNAPSPQNTWKYGIVDQNLQPKPSYTALSTLTSQLNGLDYVKTLSNKKNFKGIEAYQFAGSGMKKFVVWGYVKPDHPQVWEAPECVWPHYNNVAKFKAKAVRVVKYNGRTKNIKDNSPKDLDPTLGSIGVKAGIDPVIVQINP